MRAACAEDRDIWQIYAINFGPTDFDASIDASRGKPQQPHLRPVRRRRAGRACRASSASTKAAACLEIGGTYYRPHLRGTGFNRRVKDMMLERAFDCGFRRVEFRVDSRNARSQAAMKKLGAVREGVMRADRITWTGHVRDTVLFSILSDEWRAA